MRRNARPGARSTSRGVRRCHERICPVIDVEKSSLRAFKQNVVAATSRLVQEDHSVSDKRLQAIARGAVLGMDFLERKRFRSECSKDFVILFDAEGELLFE